MLIRKAEHASAILGGIQFLIFGIHTHGLLRDPNLETLIHAQSSFEALAPIRAARIVKFAAAVEAKAGHFGL